MNDQLGMSSNMIENDYSHLKDTNIYSPDMVSELKTPTRKNHTEGNENFKQFFGMSETSQPKHLEEPDHLSLSS